MPSAILSHGRLSHGFCSLGAYTQKWHHGRGSFKAGREIFTVPAMFYKTKVMGHRVGCHCVPTQSKEPRTSCFPYDFIVHNLSTHMHGLQCRICSTTVPEGKHCFSFSQPRLLASLITWLVYGRNWTQTWVHLIYWEPLSITCFQHFPSQVPAVRGSLRLTTDALDTVSNPLMPLRLLI